MTNTFYLLAVYTLFDQICHLYEMALLIWLVDYCCIFFMTFLTCLFSLAGEKHFYWSRKVYNWLKDEDKKWSGKCYVRTYEVQKWSGTCTVISRKDFMYIQTSDGYDDKD